MKRGRSGSEERLPFAEALFTPLYAGGEVDLYKCLFIGCKGVNNDFLPFCMEVGTGVLFFEKVTGMKAPVELMRDVVFKILKEREE